MDQLSYFIIIYVNYVLLREYHSEGSHSLTPFIHPFYGSWHIYRNPVTVCKTTHQSALTQITPKLCDYHHHHHQRNNTERDLKKKNTVNFHVLSLYLNMWYTNLHVQADFGGGLKDPSSLHTFFPFKRTVVTFFMACWWHFTGSQDYMLDKWVCDTFPHQHSST